MALEGNREFVTTSSADDSEGEIEQIAGVSETSDDSD